MSNTGVSTALSSLAAEEAEWDSTGLDNDGSMELMLQEQDSDERSVTKMIPSDGGKGSQAVPFVKQWSYSLHGMPLTKEASRMTLKAGKAAKAKLQQDLHLRGYRALDCKRKCGEYTSWSGALEKKRRGVTTGILFSALVATSRSFCKFINICKFTS